MALPSDEYIKEKFAEIEKLHPEKHLIIKVIGLGLMIFQEQIFKDFLDYYSNIKSTENN